MPRSFATVFALAGTFLLGVAPLPARPELPGSAPGDLPHTGEARFGEHRYRIIGKVRLVLFSEKALAKGDERVIESRLLDQIQKDLVLFR